MASAIPPENEIRAFAEAAGHVDAQGRYTAPRAQLAAGAAEYAQQRAQGEERRRESTARRLVQLSADLVAEGVAEATARDIMKAVAPALIRREGLKLAGGPAPHE